LRIFWADEEKVLKELVDTVAKTHERQGDGKHRQSRSPAARAVSKRDSESFSATFSELSEENRTGYGVENTGNI
jgi:hypothetical protein